MASAVPAANRVLIQKLGRRRKLIRRLGSHPARVTWSLEPSDHDSTAPTGYANGPQERQSRYFTNTTSLRFSLYSSSSTVARTVRIPDPPGRIPLSYRK